MKILSIIAFITLLTEAHAQNTFPSNSNVGIGTTSPDTRLVIQANSLDNLISFWNGSGVKKAYIGTSVAVGQMIPGTSVSDFILRAENQKIFFSADAGNTANLVINPNGNVGVGTTIPTQKLDVRGTIVTSDVSNVVQAATVLGAAFHDYGMVGYNAIPQQTQQGYSYVGNDYASWIHFSSGGFNFYTAPVGTPGNTIGGSIKMVIRQTGNVGIGTTNPDQMLTVKGTIHSNEVKVDLNIPGPDYVFKPNYELRSLSEVKVYVDKHHHLPEVPSANQLSTSGVNLGDMNIMLLKKVEELTLYLIEKDQKDKEQQQRINKLQKQVKVLFSRSYRRK